MENCLFCGIVEGKIPAQVIYKDSATLAFLDINPRAPGHTVVISKVHAPILADLPESEVGSLFGTVKKLSAHLLSKLKADGLTIGINQGGVSGQTIEHLHVHLLPRFTGDGGSSIHSVVNNPPSENLGDIATKLTI